MIEALTNHLWQSTLFAAAVALLALALRNNRAQTRYCLWLVASLKFLVPFSVFVAFGSHLGPVVSAPIAHSALPDTVQEIGKPFVTPPVFISETGTSTVHLLPVIALAIWLCGFIAVLLRWLRSWLRVRAAVRRATPIEVRPPVKILSSQALLEPGVFGIFRPVLVLPSGITQQLTPAHLEAILAHELCHAQRRDNLAAAVHMFVEALFWFHPLVWWIGARLVEERERACDEEVIRQGNQPDVYAESILKTCQFYLESPLACVSGVTGSDLKKRVMRIMTEHVTARLNFRKKLLLGSTAVLAIALPLAIGLTKDNQSNAQSVSFEVASVKQDKSGTNASHWTDRPGRVMASNITLRDLIERAYSVKSYQISGPDWLHSERYDVAAVMASSTSREQLARMIQNLLGDRFKLAFHREQRSLPLYELTVAKAGVKIQPAKVDGHNSANYNRGYLGVQNDSMSQIAESLSRVMDRPVVDRTGLRGGFTFDLRWTPDDGLLHPTEQPGKAADDAGPSIFTAIQEQLGLRLVSKKGPVEILVIDYVQRTPTEN